MTAPLERRGPEGTHHLLAGPVALGHTLLATTPEALIEVLPFTDIATGCAMTGDIRLDNRDDIFLSLCLAQGEATIGDGELVLRSYLEWGEECVDHLLGDFAFAIWDPRSARLFCVRDHTGMRQLIYHHQPDRLFAFATEPEAVLSNPEVSRQLNETRVADFLLDIEGADLTSTFFLEVFRLPPAHCLTIGPEGIVLRRYWTLKPGPMLKLDSEDQYTAAFLKVFTEAVRCRLRSAGPVGSMLSGGMDSGSVVAVAARLQKSAGLPALKTFSAVASNPQSCRESTTIFEAVKIPYLEPTIVSPDVFDRDGAAILTMTKQVEEPFDAQMTLARTIYFRARKAGVSVMLDGVNGDVALSSATYQARLLRGGSIWQFWSEAIGEELFFGEGWTRWNSLKYNVIQALAPNWFRWLWRRLPPNRPGPLLDKGFAKRSHALTRCDGYWRLNQGWGRNLAEDRCQAMMSANPVVARERYDRISAACALESRDPFMDIRLLEFSSRLPAGMLQKRGWRKLILRRAMAGLLPEKVIWRRGKEHVGWHFTQALISRFPNYLRFESTPLELASPFVAGPWLKAAGQAGTGTDMAWEDFRIASLVHWLRGS